MSYHYVVRFASDLMIKESKEHKLPRKSLKRYACLFHLLETHKNNIIEVFYGTQYDPTVVQLYYRFFSMGKW
jgi:uncharacterized pyridoxamine 5'-phosphate oxidase family protein